MYASGTSLNNFGLFGRMDGGTIKNVRLTDTYFGIHKSTTKPANVFSGSILGSGNGTIQNVYSSAIVSSDKGIGLGGIVGTGRSFTEAKDLVIESCWFDGKVILTSGAVQGGGMLGMTYADNLPKSVSITNCLNTGSITQTGTNTSYKYDRIGG